MVEWSIFAWSQLSRDDLYDALVLRHRVFVVEQNCAYQDCDGSDRYAAHLIGRLDGSIVAYARLFPSGVKYNECSIGRVVTAPEVRRTGVGKTLMEKAISETWRLFGRGGVRISAQRYLERFYHELGFATVSEPYDEDGIPHVEMFHVGTEPG